MIADTFWSCFILLSVISLYPVIHILYIVCLFTVIKTQKIHILIEFIFCFSEDSDFVAGDSAGSADEFE